MIAPQAAYSSMFARAAGSCSELLTNSGNSAGQIRLRALLKKTTKDQYGPNCYAVAMHGVYEGLPLRYMSEKEIRYLIARDFVPLASIRRSRQGFVLPARIRPGDIIVFENYDHVATYWGDGKVVDTRGPEYHYEFRLIDLNAAHTGISAPPGIRFDERSMFEDPAPFSRARIFRFSGLNRSEPARTLPAIAVRAALGEYLAGDLGAPKPVNKAVIDTAAALVRLELGDRKDGIAQTDRELGTQITETLLRLDALTEWYDGFFERRFFSSAHASLESVMRSIGDEYRPNPKDPRMLGLLEQVWRAYGVPATTTAEVQSGVRKMADLLERRLQGVARDTDLYHTNFNLIELAKTASRIER